MTARELEPASLALHHCQHGQVALSAIMYSCQLSYLSLSPGSCLLQIAGILTGSTALVGKSLDSDMIIEPVRGPLIPGFAAVKAAAKAAGDASCLH